MTELGLRLRSAIFNLAITKSLFILSPKAQPTALARRSTISLRGHQVAPSPAPALQTCEFHQALNALVVDAQTHVAQLSLHAGAPISAVAHDMDLANALSHDWLDQRIDVLSMALYLLANQAVVFANMKRSWVTWRNWRRSRASSWRLSRG